MDKVIIQTELSPIQPLTNIPLLFQTYKKLQRKEKSKQRMEKLEKLRLDRLN